MLNRAYELERAIHRSAMQVDSLSEEIAKAKAELRAARVAAVEYSGLRALADKLRGRYAEVSEQLARQERHAEEKLKDLQRRREGEKARLAEWKEARAALPSGEELRTTENREQWALLEKAYCAEVLLPKLDALEEALEEYRKMLRGEYPILSLETQAEISAAPIAAGNACAEPLGRLEKALEILGKGSEIPAFFHNPAGFLAAAARHNQLERAVQADQQILALRKLLKEYR